MPDKVLTTEEANHALADAWTERQMAYAYARDLRAERDLALAQVKALREALIQPFYRATDPDSPQWWSCRVCSYTWRAWQDERHEAHCPFAAMPAQEATNG